MILITGGKGFIGNSLTKHLPLNQYIILDPKCSASNKNEICGVTNSKKSLTQAFSYKPINTVVHLGMSSTSKEVAEDPKIGKSSIIEGTKKLLESMKENSCKRIIFISSSMVYGNFTKSEALESDECKPIDLYGKYKLEAEELVKDFCIKNKMNFIIIRPTAVYGPSDNKSRVVETFISNARKGIVIKIKGANTFLDFTYIEDLSRGIVSLLNQETIKDEVFNLSYGHARNLVELAEIIKKYYPNLKIEIENQDSKTPKRGKLNTQKARESFNFSPNVSLEEGIKKIIGDVI